MLSMYFSDIGARKDFGGIAITFVMFLLEPGLTRDRNRMVTIAMFFEF